MIKAVVKENSVINIIEIDEKNVSSYETLTKTALFDVNLLGLTMGDTYDGTDFYRDGVKLPIVVENTEPDAAAMEAALNELGVRTRA